MRLHHTDGRKRARRARRWPGRSGAMRSPTTKLIRCLAACLVLGGAPVLRAAEPDAGGDSEAELAMKLQNPVASLISVPIQSNWDFEIGSANAMRYLVNVQPVIPFSLTKDLNLITRTIVPIIHLEP